MRLRFFSPLAILLILGACQTREYDVLTNTGAKEDGSRYERKEVVITAQAEDRTPETRTEIHWNSDKRETYWLPGDKVMIYSAGEASEFTSLNTESSKIAKFKGTISAITGAEDGTDKDYVWGIYPSSAAISYNESSGKSGTAVIRADFPAIQHARGGSYADDCAIMVGRSESLSIYFKNVYSGFYFLFNRDDITSITLRSVGGEPLAGVVDISMNSDGDPVATPVEGQTTDEITLIAPDGGTFDKSTEYYILMLPVTFSQGVYATMRLKDGLEGTYRLPNTNLKMNRSNFRKFNTPDDRVSAPDNISSGLSTGWVKSATQGLNEIWYTTSDNKVVTYGGASKNDVEIIAPKDNGGVGIIRFPSAITEVEEEAFMNCFNMTSVTLPGLVETIGEDAFSGCSSLAQVHFPKSLKEIGPFAFDSCIFEEITLPEGLEAIGYMAFAACNNLKSVTIPQSVKHLGTYPGALNAGASFYNCSNLEAFYGKFASDDHKCLIAETDQKLLNSFASAGMDGKTYTIPSGVTYISPYAFSHASISGVEFPSSLRKILGYAFSESGLKSVTIPATVTHLGPFVFESCSQMQWIKIEGDGRVIQPIQNFGSLGYFFYETNDCPIYVPASLLEWYKTSNYWKVYADRYQSILADNEIRYTTTDGEKLKFNSDSDASILGSWYSSSTYENGVGTITHDGTITEIPAKIFNYCTNLKSVILPEGVLTIGSFAFDHCGNLESVTFGNKVQTIKSAAFYDCPLTSLTLPNSLTTLEGSAFFSGDNPSTYTSVNIPAAVTSLDGNPFDGCPNLKTFTGESQLISSDGRYLAKDGVMYSFAGGGLSEYTVPSEIKTLESYAMAGCGLETVVFSEGVETMKDHVLSFCNNLKEITIPASVTSIGGSAFSPGSSLARIIMKGATPPTISRYGIVSSETLDNEDFSIEIPGAGCTSYRTASYWSDLESHFVCYQADNEIWYHLANNESTAIGNTDGDFGANYLREDVVALKAIRDVRPTINISSAYDNLFRVMVFDGDVTLVGDHFFDASQNSDYATKLDWCSLPWTVTTIGEAAFKGCSKLRRLPLHAGWTSSSYNYSWRLTSIGNEAFNGCSSMVLNFYEPHDENFKTAYFEALTSVGDMAFKNCSSLDLEIRLLARNVSIGADAFENSSLPGLLTSTSATIGKGAFKNCKALTSVTTSGITSITDSTFYGCSSLETVTLGQIQALTSVGKFAFTGCTSLNTVGAFGTESGTLNLPAVKSLGQYAFSDHAFTKASLESLNSLVNSPFGSSLSELNVPSVTFVGYYGIGFTTNLKKLSLPSITSLNRNAFNSAYLEELHLGPNLKSMAEVFIDFRGNEPLSLYFESETPPSIDNKTFYKNSILMTIKSIHVPKGCKEAYVTALKNANEAYSVYESVIVEDL